MPDPRLPPSKDLRQPGAQFRCPRCQRFVKANIHGVCPGCGIGPPAATPLPAGSAFPSYRRLGLILAVCAAMAMGFLVASAFGLL